ncbi:MAG: exonuclease domain-containing protein [Chitinophagaceae bacterium]
MNPKKQSVLAKEGNKKEYAIVDIETTGGHASACGITDIAIVVTDGDNILERYETLVNPLQYIPRHIQSLTGISNDMVEDAPLFGEIAEDVYRLLSNRVFVAHNVNFDYSFVRYALEQEGFTLKVSKLCTVRISRKIRPGLPSYSLGRLCKSLEIPLQNRHRAGGDADATALLFLRMLGWDDKGHIAKMLTTETKEQHLPPQLPRSEFDQLPDKPGIYYFLNEKLKPIYVGKAVNIKKRVAQHFTGTNFGPQRQRFLQEVYHLSFEECATELMAFLLEATEIKRLWPKYNQALKRFEPKFGLIDYKDQNGYRRLVVGRINRNQVALHTFCSEEDGRDFLHHLVQDFSLCPVRCQLGKCALEATCYSCHVTQEEPESYNERVHDAIQHLRDYAPSFLIVDKGRNTNEKSCVWFENGHFAGMGYVDKETQLADNASVVDRLKRYSTFQYTNQLVENYAREYPSKVVVL